MKRNMLKRVEERTLLELLQAAGEATPDGFWRYHQGESDQTMLCRLNKRYPARALPFTTQHVMGYRRELFGQLAKGSAEASSSTLRAVEDRLDELTARLRKLEAWAAARPHTSFNGR